jgi:hypothetical protein
VPFTSLCTTNPIFWLGNAPAIATAVLLSAACWRKIHIRSDYHFRQISKNKLNKSLNALMTKAGTVRFARQIEPQAQLSLHVSLLFILRSAK